MASFSQTLIDNPVAEAELNHQQRTAYRQKWQRWPGVFAAGLTIALISHVCLLLTPQIAALLHTPAADLHEFLRGWFGTIVVLMGALIVIHQLSFSAVALQLASTSIAREKQGRTWESLLLTGLDARRIILGKWSATLRTLWQVYRPLLVLRFVVAVWMGLSSGYARVTPFVTTLPLPNILLISLITAIFPLCHASFSVTIGLLASLLVKSETTAHRIASSIHFTLIVLSIGMILLSFVLPFSEIEPALASFIPALFVTPLDSGMLALIGLIANSEASALAYLIGLLFCLALYGALTWAALRGAQALAVRQRALPPI